MKEDTATGGGPLSNVRLQRTIAEQNEHPVLDERLAERPRYYLNPSPWPENSLVQVDSLLIAQAELSPEVLLITGLAGLFP